METIKVDILNPKAKTILKNLADLNLIRIKSSRVKSELKDLLTRLRINQDEIPSLEEITAEVDLVRKARYEK
jgi:phosphoribosylformylglycinamidine (FGAM) synthase PurS component